MSVRQKLLGFADSMLQPLDKRIKGLDFTVFQYLVASNLSSFFEKKKKELKDDILKSLRIAVFRRDKCGSHSVVYGHSLCL